MCTWDEYKVNRPLINNIHIEDIGPKIMRACPKLVEEILVMVNLPWMHSIYGNEKSYYAISRYALDL